MLRYSRSFVAVLAGGVLLAACIGCSGRSFDKYIPTEDRARQALEAALNAWQDGKKPGPVAGAPMPVQAVDSHWLAGQKISHYEILNEEPNEGPRVFAVRLTLEKPAGKQVAVRYFVVGKEPLWVYREDDYKAPAGM
jgi:hypothetical protein